MKRNILLIIISLAVGNFIFAQKNENSIKVFLKLDDYGSKSKSNISTDVLDFLVNNKVKAGLGVIAGFLNEESKTTLQSYLRKKDKDGKPLFELWHHGLYHENFGGTSYEEQKSKFEKADSIVKNMLGVQMHTFGAPGNKTDSITAVVVSENPNYKVLMFMKKYPLSNGSKISYLNQRVNMENGTGKPEFDYFVQNFEKAKAQSSPCMVFQGHPNMYTTPEKLEEFKKIVQYMIDQKVQFLTPFEYYVETK